MYLAALYPFLLGIGCPDLKHLNPLTFLKFSEFTTTTPFSSFFVLFRIFFAVTAISTAALPIHKQKIFRILE